MRRRVERRDSETCVIIPSAAIRASRKGAGLIRLLPIRAISGGQMHFRGGEAQDFAGRNSFGSTQSGRAWLVAGCYNLSLRLCFVKD